MNGPVLVTGAGGLLGGLVAWTFAQQGSDVFAFNHAQLDVSDPDAVHARIAEAKPSVVVHCAAMTNVDACESEPDRAFAVNAAGSGHIASAAAEVGAAIVAVSTDYVFDGEQAPYRETSPTNPIQVYGRSKLEGEIAVREANPRHFIVRSAWIYGVGGKNFLSKIPQYASSGDSLNVVADQFGSPTYAGDLAQAIVDLTATEAFGTLHVVNAGRCSFAEFAELAVKLLHAEVTVNRISVDDLNLPAPRPKETTMLTDAWRAAGFEPLRPWQEACADFVVASG